MLFFFVWTSVASYVVFLLSLCFYISSFGAMEMLCFVLVAFLAYIYVFAWEFVTIEYVKFNSVWQNTEILVRTSRKHAYIILTPLNPTFIK